MFSLCRSSTRSSASQQVLISSSLLHCQHFAHSHCLCELFLGILFILATKQALGGHESEEDELGPDSLSQAGWEKMVLIMFVMTLHSLTEGVGKFFCHIYCALTSILTRNGELTPL